MSTREKIIIRIVDLIIIFAIVWIFWYWHSLLVIRRNTLTSNLTGDSFIVLSELNQSSLKLLRQFLFQPLPRKRVLLVGDIMFGKGVAKLIDKNGADYLFKKISPSLDQVNFSVGNLEGPIISNTEKLSPQANIFVFATSSIKVLSLGKFKLLSLANSHILDMETEGLQETRDILKQQTIQPFGDPLDCSPNFIAKRGGIIFSGFNRISSHSCSDKKVIQAITSIKEANSHNFLIVFMYWGKEHSSTTTPEQEQLAHQAVDAGADLIIGSHPHIVERVENYKGRLIFYSLGDFISDRYVSKNTQEELGVEAIFYPHMILYKLWPIGNISSQLFLMENKPVDDFFSKLARKSDLNLRNQIKNGIIKTDLNY